MGDSLEGEVISFGCDAAVSNCLGVLVCVRDLCARYFSVILFSDMSDFKTLAMDAHVYFIKSDFRMGSACSHLDCQVAGRVIVSLCNSGVEKDWYVSQRRRSLPRDRSL